MSYDQKLYFGLTADAQAMPDVESLKAFLEGCFVELRNAAGIDEIKPKVMKAKRRKAVMVYPKQKERPDF